MSNYNVVSNKAEEFISDSEIRETMSYARENCNNIELINSILQKASPLGEDTLKGWWVGIANLPT